MRDDNDVGSAQDDPSDDVDKHPEPVGIETCRGLIEEKELRIVNERPRERNALTLSPRARSEGPVRIGTELEPIERSSDLRIGHTVELCRKGKVLSTRKVCVTEALVAEPTEAPANFLAMCADGPKVDAAARRRGQRPEDREQRRLTGAVVAKNSQNLATVDVQGDASQRTHGSVHFGNRM